MTWWKAVLGGVISYSVAGWVQDGFSVHGRAGFAVFLGVFAAGIALWTASDYWPRR